MLGRRGPFSITFPQIRNSSFFVVVIIIIILVVVIVHQMFELGFGDSHQFKLGWYQTWVLESDSMYPPVVSQHA